MACADPDCWLYTPSSAMCLHQGTLHRRDADAVGLICTSSAVLEYQVFQKLEVLDCYNDEKDWFKKRTNHLVASIKVDLMQFNLELK